MIQFAWAGRDLDYPWLQEYFKVNQFRISHWVNDFETEHTLCYICHRSVTKVMLSIFVPYAHSPGKKSLHNNMMEHVSFGGPIVSSYKRIIVSPIIQRYNAIQQVWWITMETLSQHIRLWLSDMAAQPTTRHSPQPVGRTYINKIMPPEYTSYKWARPVYEHPSIIFVPAGARTLPGRLFTFQTWAPGLFRRGGLPNPSPGRFSLLFTLC